MRNHEVPADPFKPTARQHDPEGDLIDRHCYDLDAEGSLLGAALLRSSIVGWLEIRPEQFFSPAHAQVWASMQRLYAAGSAIDPVTLQADLTREGVFDGIGGMAFISSLVVKVPSADNVDHYAEIVRSRHANRAVLEATDAIRSQLRGGTYGEELIEEAMALLNRIERPGKRADETDWATAIEDEVEAIAQHIEAERSGTKKYPGIPSGIRRMDQEIGGIPKGIVTVIGARPGEGKSSVLLNWASNMVASSADEVGLLFTYEDRFNTFAQRGLAQLSGIDGAKIRRREITPLELEELRMKARELAHRSRLKLFHAHGMRVQQLRRIVLGCRRRFNVSWIAADYIQNMPAPERGMKGHEAVAANMQVFADLAGQEGIGCIVLSQLNREFEGRKGEDRRPRLTDFKESGAIEEKAKFMIALYDNPKTADDTLELVVLKNHAGERNTIIEVRYDRARCTITDKSW